MMLKKAFFTLLIRLQFYREQIRACWQLEKRLHCLFNHADTYYILP